MVLEARGLDITPQMITRFEAAKDLKSARILGRILQDEIRHVAAGVCWFNQCCAIRGDSPPDAWRALVALHFGGSLKPPFNDSARAAAGLTIDFYQVVADAHAHRPQKFP